MSTSELERIDRDLRYIVGTLADLEDVAPDWDDESIHVKLDWYMEWGNDMDILQCLREAFENQTMTKAQEKSFVEILNWVQRLIPTIERLELEMPKVPLRT